MNEGKNEDGLFVLRNQYNKSKVLVVDDETLRNMKMGDKNLTSIMQSQKSIENEPLRRDSQKVVSSKNFFNIKGTVYEEVGESNGKVQLYNQDKD